MFFECFRTNFGYFRNCSGYFRSSSGYFGNSSGYCRNSSEYFRSSSGYLRNSSGLWQTKRPRPLLNVYTIVLHAFALSFPGICPNFQCSPTAAWPGGVACSSKSAARNPRPSATVSLVSHRKRMTSSLTFLYSWPDCLCGPCLFETPCWDNMNVSYVVSGIDFLVCFITVEFRSIDDFLS